MPSTESRSSSPESRTPSSSPVRSRSVATRQCSPRSPSWNSPKTVCVLPASTASSKRGVLVVFAAEGLAEALGPRVGRQLRLLPLTAQLLHRDVARCVNLCARYHPGPTVLVPVPDVLQPQVEERVARLWDVAQV